MRGKWERLAIGVAVAALAAGCPGLRPGLQADPAAMLAETAARVPPIVGRVVWPVRQVQAEMKDVALRATVTLIDSTTNNSLSSTISSPDGNFSLESARGFVPQATKLYYVEAYKGLFNNAVGQDAARVRTLLRFQGSWEALTPNSITLTRGTTALCALMSLKNLDDKQRAALLGKVDATGVPPTFNPAGGALSQAEFLRAYDLVTVALTGNRDPLDSLIWTNNALALRPGVGLAPPEISDVVPGQAVVGDMIAVYGSDFDPVLTKNTIDFGGVVAQPTLIKGGRLEVTVPVGAKSGLLSVTTTLGSGSIGFTVLPLIPGNFVGF